MYTILMRRHEHPLITNDTGLIDLNVIVSELVEQFRMQPVSELKAIGEGIVCSLFL